MTLKFKTYKLPFFKMQFGRLPSIENIDFKLPPDHPGTIKVLGGKKADQVSVYIGCPIWAEPGFVGKIYPKKAKSRDYVKYYSEQFNSIELNISHYKPLDKDTIEHWVDHTRSDFKFFPKVNQTISHVPQLCQSIDLMKELIDMQGLFRQKLGMPFMQLPPYYDSTKLNDFLEFCDRVAMSHYAMELRHESWFKDELVLKKVCNYFYKNNLTFLITDTAGRRDVIHQRLTTKTAFIRFVANDLHPTDFERMNDWAERLTQWIEQGLENVYFFVHTPTHAIMPEIVDYFIKAFTLRTGISVRPPRILPPDTKPQTLF